MYSRRAHAVQPQWELSRQSRRLEWVELFWSELVSLFPQALSGGHWGLIMVRDSQLAQQSIAVRIFLKTKNLAQVGKIVAGVLTPFG